VVLVAGADAGAEAVGVPEILRICPIRIELALVIAFRLIRFLVVVPNLEAIPLRVSLATTV
jgi:hypothetical protein